MTKQQSAADTTTKKAEGDASSSHHIPSSAGIRETIESIVIAFVLAFLFRTFEAEAFVIPTGSMAPTLMGRHKDLNCPKCGSPYQLSASEEAPENPNDPVRLVYSGTCPMCGYPADIGPGNPQHETYPAYNGDRILVSKFAYDLSDPQRWDVIVFHYPGDAQTNFIKRLVGLPGETVRIQNGDIWVREGKSGPFSIARKPPSKLLAMLQPVFDNDYMPKIVANGWPVRWRPAAADKRKAGWSTDDSTVFVSDPAEPGLHWLRYQHLFPTNQQWFSAEDGRITPHLEPSLITDFTAYDTGGSRENVRPDTGSNWVGDLGLEASVDILKPGGKLVLELRKGGRLFQCQFDLATGRAELSISGEEMTKWHPMAITKLQGVGKHRVRFTNCDEQLLLWVDDKLVAFDQPTTYPELRNTRPEPSDLEPAGIATDGASVRISHLRLLRDIFYLAMTIDSRGQTFQDIQYPNGQLPPANQPEMSPRPGYIEFTMGPDQFFVLGDNSAKSKDSRLWGAEYWVERDLLIGKALYIYWPHSWDEIQTPWFNIPLPFYPNFQRMGLVR